MSTIRSVARVAALSIFVLKSGCTIEAGVQSLEEKPPAPHVLVASLHDSLVSFDVETGIQRPGSIEGIGQTTDMQALHSGLVLVNLTESNEILAIDPLTMTERARVKASAADVTRPVHSFIYAENHQEKYWIATNDHNPATDSSMRFVDIDPDSATFLQAVGEAPLGKGHHKAAVSSRTPRIVVSNMFDCARILTVLDFSDVTNITTISTLAAADVGYDGANRICGVKTQPQPNPHGCGYAHATGKAYCNFTGTGVIAGVDIDSAAPTWITIPTGGSGSGYTKAHPAGRFVYSLQSDPREGNLKNLGADCQIGQLVVIDSESDIIPAKVPLFYDGPGCTRKLAGTDEATARPFRMRIANDGNTLFISLATGKGETPARVRRQVAVDITAPGAPVQLPSITTGASEGHHGDAITGDGLYLFVTDNVDNTITQVNALTREVVRTIQAGHMPHWVATFGEQEGPSHQVH